MAESGDVTVGIDIGTGSVKALAVDADGQVLARARVAHAIATPEPDQMQHDPDEAWHAGVLAAWHEVRDAVGVERIAAANVSAMVPSLCAVDAGGRALTPGLLYGDARGGPVTGKNPSESGELVGYLRWCASQAPDAVGYWPAQAMANHALTGEGIIDSVVAMTAVPLFDWTSWDPAVAASAGARPEQLPRIVVGAEPAGRTAEGVLVGGGTVDALGEQIVAGADEAGDVLMILGTTLMTWAVVDEWREVPGLWTIPHTAPGMTLIGGPSNAGGLFLNWVDALTGGSGSTGGGVVRPTPARPDRIPVWEPYVRGERTPLHDPDRRAVLHGADLTHGPDEVRRAAVEAAGFVARHHLELAGVLDGSGGTTATRLVATGGGVQAADWMQALADATGLPVDVVAVPEGAALGTAFLARVAAGLEPDASGAGRWARVARRVEPDPAWSEAMAPRYEAFRRFTDRNAG